MGEAAREASSRSRSMNSEACHSMSVLIDKTTRLIVQGLTGREGTFHAKQAQAYRHERRRRRDARQGRHDARRLAGVQHGRRRRAGDRRECVGDLRAAARRRRCGDGSRRRGTRRWPCASPKAFRRIDMMRALPFVADKPMRLIGPNCPGLISAGRAQGRHHPRPHLQGRARRHRLEERHADLRGDSPADAASVSARRRASASAAIRSSARRSSTR